MLLRTTTWKRKWSLTWSMSRTSPTDTLTRTASKDRPGKDRFPALGTLVRHNHRHRKTFVNLQKGAGRREGYIERIKMASGLGSSRIACLGEQTDRQTGALSSPPIAERIFLFLRQTQPSIWSEKCFISVRGFVVKPSSTGKLWITSNSVNGLFILISNNNNSLILYFNCLIRKVTITMLTMSYYKTWMNLTIPIKNQAISIAIRKLIFTLDN